MFQMHPVIGDVSYLEEQHLILVVKSEDNMESYGKTTMRMTLCCNDLGRTAMRMTLCCDDLGRTAMRMTLCCDDLGRTAMRMRLCMFSCSLYGPII